MNIAQEFGPLALEMLTEFGSDATLTGTGPSIAAFDKRTGRATLAAAPDGQTVLVAITPIDITDDQGRQTTKTVATMLVKPTSGDKLAHGDFTYTIGNVICVAPQGEAIVYVAEVA